MTDHYEEVKKSYGGHKLPATMPDGPSPSPPPGGGEEKAVRQPDQKPHNAKPLPTPLPPR